MTVIYRYKLIQGIWHDTGALPCPRCRSTNVETYSHPACGVLETCRDCGGRSDRQSWNDGEIDLQRTPGATTFHYVGEKFTRPASDVIVKTTRKRALKLTGQAA